MTKHRKSRKVNKRRSQRGGMWPFSSSESTDPAKPTQSWGDWFSGSVGKTENLLGSTTESLKSSATGLWDSTKNAMPDMSSTEPVVEQVDTTMVKPGESVEQVDTIMVKPGESGESIEQVDTTMVKVDGGSRRRRRSMKGGKGGLGLTYYASPVSDLKVVEPTYWIVSKTNQGLAGGSRKKHRHHNTKRNRRNTKRRQHNKKRR